MADESLNKSLYKLELAFLKILPMLLTLDVILKLILIYFDWNPTLVSYIGGISIIPLAFICLSARIFKYCWYHKMFLVYVTIDLFWSIVDVLVKFPLYINKVYCLMMITVGVLLFVILYLRDKTKHSSLFK